MKTLRIAIDVGHARGTGARGNGLEEHARCEVLAQLLRPMLERQGHVVRVFDFPQLTNRADINETVRAVNCWGADLGVSLHCDASDNAEAHGAHVCYKSAHGKVAADAVAHALCLLLPGRAEHVVKRDDLAMLNATRPAWILCECGFITNPEDAFVLQNQLDRVADAIAAGIKNYAAKL